MGCLYLVVFFLVHSWFRLVFTTIKHEVEQLEIAVDYPFFLVRVVSPFPLVSVVGVDQEGFDHVGFD